MNSPQFQDIWISNFTWSQVCVAFAKPPVTSIELERAIRSYNPSLENFDILHNFAREFPAFFHGTLPFIVKIALEFSSLFGGSFEHRLVSALNGGDANWTIALTKRQATCLVANAFLCTFPETRRHTYPYFSFRSMFSSRHTRDSRKTKAEKLKFMFTYFKQRKEILAQKDGGKDGKDVILYQRRQFQQNVEFHNCQMKLSKCKFKIGRIEDEEDALQMDFANKYIGGGVLTGGCVQEEIRFITSPDLIAGMAFTEVLRNRDVLVVEGATQTSNYQGYASTFAMSTPINKSRPFKLVAADALPFQSNPVAQFHQQNVNRELFKAISAFWNWNNERPVPVVATGNWGCGAFRGDPVLKFFIQLLAASVAERPLTYVLFDDPKLEHTLRSLFAKATESFPTVASLYCWLLDVCQQCYSYSRADFLSVAKQRLADSGNGRCKLS